MTAAPALYLVCTVFVHWNTTVLLLLLLYVCITISTSVLLLMT